jgi:hypothetical protein
MADPIRDRLADRLFHATHRLYNADYVTDAATAILEAIDARILRARLDSMARAIVAEPDAPTPEPYRISNEQFRDACDAVRPYVYTSDYSNPGTVVGLVVKALGLSRADAFAAADDQRPADGG